MADELKNFRQQLRDSERTLYEEMRANGDLFDTPRDRTITRGTSETAEPRPFEWTWNDVATLISFWFDNIVNNWRTK